MTENEPIELNPHILLDEVIKQLPETGGWVTKNTAILVVHGIGNQRPLETVDQFGRGLIAEYAKLYPDGKISLEHVLLAKPSDSGFWFDNILRIRLEGEGHYIDLYEYYWANYTEDKASFTDIQRWLNGVTDGAAKFYAKIADIAKKTGDNGPFFDSKGSFIHWKYSLFLKSITYLIPFFTGLFNLLGWAFSLIPVVGKYIADLFKGMTANISYSLSNVIGDIVVYNVTDPKSKYYAVKRLILDGAVSALSYLIQRTNEAGDELYYPKIIMAGHSLGTQVSYDAINKLNLLINEGKITSYNEQGVCTLPKNKDLGICEHLSGYITFGSPLDKIAFFLQEIVPDTMYVRKQLLDDYHGFKQKDWNRLTRKDTTPPAFYLIVNPLTRLLQDIKWRNYHDRRDYVSGQLDYYDKLTNIDCGYQSPWYGFTHSYYWEDGRFYKDVIFNFLG